MKLTVQKTANPKVKPAGVPKFGTVFTDHMFVMEYGGGEWKNARIQPYAPFTLDPSTSVFHYGQAVFEGAKAFKNKNGEIRIFRIEQNFARMNESCARVCIPAFDPSFVESALKELVLLDGDWIPTDEGTALYIRPAVVASDAALGVHTARNYIFFIILSPVGAYYENGLAPVKLYVETEYVRASRGGTGHHKVAGNYAASLKSGERAARCGCDQVMWLDAREHKYVEEVGSMNIFFRVGDRVITPELGGSILPGITRKSVIELLKSRGIRVDERPVAVDEVVAAIGDGSLTEIFGTGTAAVISPVGAIMLNGRELTVNGGEFGELSASVFDELTGIQTGRLPDRFGWVKRWR
ncbi:MAG: branched-chain amino acid aminotransferase [Clostridiales bacterium]|jgi:branched-chain amino acid aminotransferase|nr:branched-chain amino acid aminotransferase [Clostridiales bacterium]